LTLLITDLTVIHANVDNRMIIRASITDYRPLPTVIVTDMIIPTMRMY